MNKKIILVIFAVLIIQIAIPNIGIAKNDIENFHNIVIKPLSVNSTQIRQPAEFERMESVLIRYPFKIPYDLIAGMAEDIEVITIVASESEMNYVENLYQNNGVNINHTIYLVAPSDGCWTRDYGPWFIFNQTNNNLEVVDFEYNRPRPNDDNIPYEFALNQSLLYHYMDIILTGGNYMTDGQGISVSTTLVWDENPGMTHDLINQTMSQYLGIKTYHVIPDVNNEYIKHIDCWGKYLSPDTILIREVPKINPQYDEIEAAVNYFENQLSCYGTPYTVVRVYTPNNEPYTNSLILNDKVLVPITGSQWDDEAIQSYENAMPGYEVLGFTALNDYPWLSTDAIHCRAIGIPDRDMLYIEHIPLSGYNGFNVKATIIPYSGEGVKSAVLYWKLEGDDWNSIEMNHTGGFCYESNLPIQKLGEKVYYYIEAEDNSGRSENHPFIGKANPHSFIVYNIPPEKPIITGDSSGKSGTEYEYKFMSTDPEGDNITYCINWGGNTGEAYIGPYPSGEKASASHTWSEKGNYTIKAKARDINGAESAWATLTVSMPKVKNVESVPFGFIFVYGGSVDIKIVHIEPGDNYVDLEVLNKPLYIWENEIITINPGAFVRLNEAKGLFLPSFPLCIGICNDYGIIG